MNDTVEHHTGLAMAEHSSIDSHSLRGQNILVIGMARSGVAAARLLAGYGAQVFVSDAAPQSRLESATHELTSLGVHYEVGKHTLDALQNVELVITSPGVPPDNLLIRESRYRNIPVISELEAAFALTRAPILAVTGSNGKTTTTAWLGAIYKRAGHSVEVGGNIGRPFSEFAATIDVDARAILEVSTFQLERIDRFRPHVGSILNLSPDHLDRHGSFDEYIRLKFELLTNQTPSDVAVLNADDGTIVSFDQAHHPGGAVRWWFSGQGEVPQGAWLGASGLHYRLSDSAGVIPGSDRLKPPGDHNRLNAAAAVAMALADGLTPPEIEPGLISFTGIEHRLEMVATINGVTFINDSKATNPDSVAKALAAFDRPLIVIMGGLAKGTEFTWLVKTVQQSARACVFTGQARKQLERELGSHVTHRTTENFEDAFQCAVTLAQSGDIVLLSPGCASFDQFESYEHRGNTFKRLVAELESDGGVE